MSTILEHLKYCINSYSPAPRQFRAAPRETVTIVVYTFVRDPYFVHSTSLNAAMIIRIIITYHMSNKFLSPQIKNHYIMANQFQCELLIHSLKMQYLIVVMSFSINYNYIVLFFRDTLKLIHKQTAMQNIQVPQNTNNQLLTSRH